MSGRWKLALALLFLCWLGIGWLLLEGTRNTPVKVRDAEDSAPFFEFIPKSDQRTFVEDGNQEKP